MKIALWIIAGIVAILVFVVGIKGYMLYKEFKTSNPEYIMEFVKEHAANGDVAMSIQYNDENWVNVNENERLPLASTVKIILAITYAQQAAEGKINPKQLVSVADLNKFYLPKTDGGAHEAWLAQMPKEDMVPLEEVVKGMIAYSSNANTDYLMDVLGMENINNTLQQLELSKHDVIYPITSVLYIPSQLMQEQNLSSKELVEAMQAMDMEEYRNRAIAIYHQWQTAPLSKEEKEQLLKTLSMDIQKVWSDRLPASTTKDYVAIMEKLNNKSYFSEEVYQYLDPVMEQLMESPTNRELFKHAGQKGGSTAFVLTIAMYAMDQQQNRTELAFFANNLSVLEQAKLERNLNSFQLKFLTEEVFREKVKRELGGN
ncbi:serine hydrolase [Lysinibacillus louembei]|uniref:Serine hydrolase n=1 Tax=Lysinibacillus louembei TaxID=1470088 RepID=A0ABZ0S205_9BACI|nr:serine hydrolase [Lysinibacillus louembei]WPK13694.1 serine hydrolase [Lysinibacillus louembei]